MKELMKEIWHEFRVPVLYIAQVYAVALAFVALDTVAPIVESPLGAAGFFGGVITLLIFGILNWFRLLQKAERKGWL